MAEWNADGDLVDSGVVAVSHQVIRKASDETVNNSATLQNDDELTFSVAANETWVGLIALYVNSGTTPDIKWDTTGPSGSTIVMWNLAAALATTDFNSASVAINVGSSSFGGTTSTAFVQIMFSIANGATPGSFTLRWAQQTANASNTIVKAGSFLLAHKV